RSGSNMLAKIKMTKRMGVIGAMTAAALLIGGIAFASIPGSDGVIHGCFKTANPGKGALIAIDSAATCPSGFTALNWNQTGPTGPQGPQGPAGPPGPVNVTVVNSPANATIPAGSYNQATASCLPGQIAIAGGYFVNGNGD